ncbi:Tetracycline repressor protein class A from transposon [compost metagenome]
MRIVKEHVIDTALSLLDSTGIEGLTLRKLAAALEIQVPSLYWHYKNKERLFEDVADALLRGVALQVHDAPWDVKLLGIAKEIRQALLSRRDAARFLSVTCPVSDNVLRVSSMMIECLTGAGLDDRTAQRGAFTIMHYVLGFTVEEQALSGRSNDQVKMEELKELFEAYPMGRSLFMDIAEGSPDERFEFGIELTLEGLRRHVEKVKGRLSNRP